MVQRFHHFGLKFAGMIPDLYYNVPNLSLALPEKEVVGVESLTNCRYFYYLK